MTILDFLKKHSSTGSSYLKDTPLEKLVVVKDPNSNRIEGYLRCEDTDKQYARTIFLDLMGCYPFDISLSNIEFVFFLNEIQLLL